MWLIEPTYVPSEDWRYQCFLEEAFLTWLLAFCCWVTAWTKSLELTIPLLAPLPLFRWEPPCRWAVTDVSFVTTTTGKLSTIRLAESGTSTSSVSSSSSISPSSRISWRAWKPFGEMQSLLEFCTLRGEAWGLPWPELFLQTRRNYKPEQKDEKQTGIPIKIRSDFIESTPNER